MRYELTELLFVLGLYDSPSKLLMDSYICLVIMNSMYGWSAGNMYF